MTMILTKKPKLDLPKSNKGEGLWTEKNKAALGIAKTMSTYTSKIFWKQCTIAMMRKLRKSYK